MTVKGFPCCDISIVGFSRTAALLILASVLALPSLVGCGAAPTGPERFSVNGTVTREGIPMDDGTIMFSPTVGGPAVMGQIVKGEYKFDEVDGVPNGKYNVVIVAKPLRDPTFVGRKNEAPVLVDERFKKEAPSAGWKQEAEVNATSTKLNFAVDP